MQSESAAHLYTVRVVTFGVSRSPPGPAFIYMMREGTSAVGLGSGDTIQMNLRFSVILVGWLVCVFCESVDKLCLGGFGAVFWRGWGGFRVRYADFMVCNSLILFVFTYFSAETLIFFDFGVAAIGNSP
ncbi:hypothetical protein [Phaeobacter piscinae]|uniref:hypothetical protein n=1 Tax=Phaeobacter piscinae TaxID=1580596 RepID=UPI000F463576|nr:hypothetical protein [Phaeobacter piscinae]